MTAINPVPREYPAKESHDGVDFTTPPENVGGLANWATYAEAVTKAIALVIKDVKPSKFQKQEIDVTITYV